MIKVFVDKDIAQQGYPDVPILLPFNRDRKENAASMIDSRFQKWLRRGAKLMQVVDTASEADIAIVPHDLASYLKDSNSRRILEESISKSLQIGLLTWGFYWSDDDNPVDLKGIRIFRTGGMGKTCRVYEEAQPSFCKDPLLEVDSPVQNIARSTKSPRVAFCGNADKPTNRFKMNNFLQKLFVHSISKGDAARQLRLRAMRTLMLDERIDVNFEIFEEFFVGETVLSEKERLRRRQLFIENMLSAEYALTVRGSGNYSYRHYEAMSLGRIPLFINTDCVLPLSDKIDWSRHLITVPENKLKELPEYLLEFHMNVDDINQISKTNRSIWEKYLSADGFFETILNDPQRKDTEFVSHNGSII